MRLSAMLDPKQETNEDKPRESASLYIFTIGLRYPKDR